MLFSLKSVNIPACKELKKFSGVLVKGHMPGLTVRETELGKSCKRGH